MFLRRQGAQLQVWSLPWLPSMGVQGALDEDLRTLPTTGVLLPLTSSRPRDLSPTS